MPSRADRDYNLAFVLAADVCRPPLQPRLSLNAFDVILLSAVGIFCGVLNTIAGGGSLLSVPLLSMLGGPDLTITIANATSRPAIVLQNTFAALGFYKAGVYHRPTVMRRAWICSLCALPGTFLGAAVAATKVSDEWFERILAAALLATLIYTWIRRARSAKPGAQEQAERPERNWITYVGFVGIGFYGGFIQAGVGFVIMALLLNTTTLRMAEVNCIKVTCVLLYMPIAVAVFLYHGQIRWDYSLVLIVSQSIGGSLGSRVAIVVGDATLMRIYSACLLAFAIWLGL